MQPRGYIKVLSLALLLAIIPAIGTTAKADTTSSATAEKTGLYSTGARFGTSFRGEDTDQADFFVARKLPWARNLSSGWNLGAAVELDLSILQHDDEEVVAGSVSTDLILSSPGHRFFLLTGVGAGVLEDEILGDINFGGPVFFLFHAGAGLRLTPWLSLGYRYSHMSNGGIYSRNPSLNLNMVELRFTF
ncbi:acyloxyacyl hydrolase [Desulfoprunum benzoelyticum]|uniref:Lipid A 3-O-deacylase n=1 Tax=Desulfoprunum benzoelyticum TaxID=1506996 RepID=A0A840UUS9_9BACT|nr:acyloxyacyl hydrolase [Desulfoprunum benzoelyticum]MBB5349445.1 hypothetical protein [Desulfoprunum benzoelyticum]MBM9531698.1 acyloxyacyl hydrolase [Desulfoprunum benzoelyticum]